MANASKTVQVVADAGMITIRCGDAMISEHPQAFLKNGQCLVQREYLDELQPLSVRRYSGAPCCPMAFRNHSGTSKPLWKCARAAR
jgi:hypothetical protein